MAMCAIAGAVGTAVDAAAEKKMLATMARRGPDGQGCWRQADCCLLHSRLSVIDPEGGAQPMHLQWGGEEYCIVYNGELYNTQQVRQALLRCGHQFQGHSDTEVVLHAYAQYGRGCLDIFNGIFAFAVWESGSNRLFLARDRIGVKPLFFWNQGDRLVFASEIKTLLAHPNIKPRLDAEGAAQLLLLGPGRLPGSGVFQGIQEVEPGCCGYFTGGKLHLERYWKLRDREHRDSFAVTVDTVRTLVLDAVQRQLVADVSVGTFLSGGLDSSIISSIAAREMKERGQRLMTFSVDYQDNARHFVSGKFQPEADTAYIQKMQTYLDSDHSWTILTPEQLDAALEDATLARDLPGMGDVDISLLLLCRRIREKVKVALSGECADEIFGGYPWYRDPEIRQQEGFPWAQNTARRAELLSPALSAVLRPEDFVMDAYRQTVAQSDILPGTPPQERRMKEMVNLNFSWFMQTLLDRKDRMSMDTSLEVRVPFCDYRIAEYLYGVPWAYKDYQGREKGLLRQAMEGLLPEEVLQRKKSPYPKTFDPAYTELMRRRLGEVLSKRDSPLENLVDIQKLRGLLSGEMSWPWYGQLMRNPQTMAYFIQLDFWLRYWDVELLFG